MRVCGRDNVVLHAHSSQQRSGGAPNVQRTSEGQPPISQQRVCWALLAICPALGQQELLGSGTSGSLSLNVDMKKELDFFGKRCSSWRSWTLVSLTICFWSSLVQCFRPRYCLCKATEENPVPLSQSRYVNPKHQDQVVVLELDGVPNFPLQF